jgi:hypothetical protein
MHHIKSFIKIQPNHINNQTLINPATDITVYQQKLVLLPFLKPNWWQLKVEKEKLLLPFLKRRSYSYPF